jgi:IS30 family transposase
MYSQRPWEHRKVGNLDRFMVLWNEGLPIRAIALRLGISLSTVWMVTKRHNLQRAHTPGQAASYQRRRRERS